MKGTVSESMIKPALYISLPVMDELHSLPVVLKALSQQSFQDYKLYVCVNQPDEWWDNPAKARVCKENMATLEMLHSITDPRITCIDKCSPGKGWQGKYHGIGWARKVLMDEIDAIASKEDILLSLDADTVFGPEYLSSVVENFQLNPGIAGLSIPYYHYLTGSETLDRAMLRYEFYMRAYAINLWMINCPYSFTALGSAIAFPLWSYRKIGGITPKLSGEDFYLLQKLVKSGKLLHWNRDMVFPAARLSERVFFGTGPALIKGMENQWESYPIYRMELFKEVEYTQRLFGKLYEQDLDTPMNDFLARRVGGLPWKVLRANAGSREQFIRSCHEKIDGLRILQFLKERNQQEPYPDEMALGELLALIEGEQYQDQMVLAEGITFHKLSLPSLDDIRRKLFDCEMKYRIQHWEAYSGLLTTMN